MPPPRNPSSPWWPPRTPGGLALQLGGNRVGVLSIVSDPNTDPHGYETNPSNAKKDGDSPHFWYGPTNGYAVLNAITADYEAIDPTHRPYYVSRHAAVESSFGPYRARLRYISAHFARRPVAATESIFEYMARSLILDLVTPYAFMQAVAEGNDPPARSVASFYRQIQQKAFGVLVYNVQTVTPLTTN
jgi:zinc/manganese transport system substrate-binding protein